MHKSVEFRHFLLILIFSFQSLTWAQTCGDLFSFRTESEKIRFKVFKSAFQTEFGLKMIPEFEEAFRKFMNEPDEFQTDQKSKNQIFGFFESKQLIDRQQRKLAEKILNRSLTDQQAVGIRAARVLDRDMDLLEGTKSGISEEQAFELKQRFLKFFKFSEQEILSLYESEILSDQLLKEARFDILSSYDPNEITPEMLSAKNEAILKKARHFENEYTWRIDKLKNKDPQFYAEVKAGKLKKAAVDQKEIQQIFDTVALNSKTRVFSLWKYDPQGKFGFCFGRALFVHLTALRRGVHKDSIKKVFVVGPMKGFLPGQTWGFHVATMIAKEGGGFWVVDPFEGKPLTLDEWFEHNNSKSQDQRLRLFVAPASRFGRAGFNPVNGDHLYEGYNNYFKDAMKNYKENDFGPEKKVSFPVKLMNKILQYLKIGI